METLLIDSAIDEKYGYLKRFLINGITQGHNRYPNSKAAKYNMLCNNPPERTNNNNESTTMCNGLPRVFHSTNVPPLFIGHQ